MAQIFSKKEYKEQLKGLCVVEISGESMIVTTRDWEGNLMDKIEIKPNQPFKVLETTYENYQPYQGE